MIDIHTHILHGVDDGPDTIEISIEMARDAFSSGTTIIVASPHIIPGAFEADMVTILSRVRELNSALKSRRIPVSVLPGAEVALESDVPQRLASGRLCTIGGDSHYLLLELPFQGIPVFSEQVIFKLSSRGYVPVIAHPERNNRIISDPNIFLRFVQLGALGQVNAGSLTGEFGAHVRRAAEILVTCGMAHVIASDGHSVSTRRCRLDRARDRVIRLVGRERAMQMTEEFPKAIINDIDIEPGEAEAYRPAKRFVFGWGRR
ncbi:MAG TPA: hypothetical protein GX506_03725 [Firmicutes bacterium]|nr:hypothetical protein [Bacillota bacterium]